MAECVCGRFYETEKGVELCKFNQHGDGKDHFGKALQFRHAVETSFSVVCAACNRPLRASMRVIDGSMIEFNVIPHVCDVEDPQTNSEGGVA